MKWIKSPGLWIQTEQDMQRKLLTFEQQHDIYKFLKDFSHLDEEGHFIYHDDWNDERVAQHFNVTTTNVRTIRAKLGMLRVRTDHLVGPRLAAAEAKIKALEDALGTKVANLHARINDLEAKINKLSLREHFRA